MLVALFGLLTVFLGFFDNADDDASSVADDLVGADGADDSSWFTGLWNGTKDVAGAVGKGLASVDLSEADAAITSFALKKEAGVYASLGIGDDGATQAASSAISEVVGSPWLWWAGLGLVVYTVFRR